MDVNLDPACSLVSQPEDKPFDGGIVMLPEIVS
jgi:hypothetical protein